MKRRYSDVIYTNIFKIGEIEICDVIFAFAFGIKNLFFNTDQFLAQM